MSDASPQDLSVTFRSIPRRRREARGDAPPDLTATLDRQIDQQLDAAAALMRSPADPPLIADAIEAVRAKDWDPSVLESLRTIATDLGRLLREMQRLTADPGA